VAFLFSEFYAITLKALSELGVARFDEEREIKSRRKRFTSETARPKYAEMSGIAYRRTSCF
jgi:hypothetical protein